jgi:hypothetical protein
MTQSNRLLPIILALIAGATGLLLALTSLAHNIQGVLPRITAQTGSFEHYIQMTTEGGATIGLNIAALLGFTFAGVLWKRDNRIISVGIACGAILAILWSGMTQLGVIAEKTFHVSGSKENSMRLYKKALKEHKEIIDAMPAFHQYLGTAHAEVVQARAALKSHKYGKLTAWQTTKECTGDITSPASIKLCQRYAKAVKMLERSKYAADLEKRRVAVNAILAKGPPTTIDAGPELVAKASMGLLSVKAVQIILVFMRSFAIDLIAGFLFAGCINLWPAKLYRASDAHTASAHGASDGGLDVQLDKPGQPDTPKNTRVHSQRVIDQMKTGVPSVQNTEHAQVTVFKAIQKLSRDGHLKTTYRVLSAHSGVSTGSMNEILNTLEANGLVERTLNSKAKGTHLRVLNTEHAFA